MPKQNEHQIPPSAPPSVLTDYRDWFWTLAWDNAPNIQTWALDRPDGRRRYLKLARTGRYPSLADEEARMRWARTFLPVPQVLGAGSEDETDWLLTVGLPGTSAVAASLIAEPSLLVPALARGLRRFHEAPIAECPFDFRVVHALGHVQKRVANRLIDYAEHLHPEHRHLGADSVVEELVRLAPSTEDLVVCHGDYCLPNALLQDGEVTGFVDLGELGVADRWWDLAIATWSVTWNLGPGWEDLFLQTYGIERDERRVRFYRLLYDLVS